VCNKVCSCWEGRAATFSGYTCNTECSPRLTIASRNAVGSCHQHHMTVFLSCTTVVLNNYFKPAAVKSCTAHFRLHSSSAGKPPLSQYLGTLRLTPHLWAGHVDERWLCLPPSYRPAAESIKGTAWGSPVAQGRSRGSKCPVPGTPAGPHPQPALPHWLQLPLTPPQCCQSQ